MPSIEETMSISVMTAMYTCTVYTHRHLIIALTVI